MAPDLVRTVVVSERGPLGFLAGEGATAFFFDPCLFSYFFCFVSGVAGALLVDRRVFTPLAWMRGGPGPRMSLGGLCFANLRSSAWLFSTLPFCFVSPQWFSF